MNHINFDLGQGCGSFSYHVWAMGVPETATRRYFFCCVQLRLGVDPKSVAPVFSRKELGWAMKVDEGGAPYWITWFNRGLLDLWRILQIDPSIYLSIQPSIHPFIHPSIYLCFYLSIYISICLSILSYPILSYPIYYIILYLIFMDDLSIVNLVNIV